MSLREFSRDLKIVASALPKRYEDYTIDELADGYCDAIDQGDRRNAEIYISALLLRYSYKFGPIYQATKDKGFDYGDAINQVYDCIQAACQYRAWRNKDKHTNADACIKQVIKSRGVLVMFYQASLQKNTRGEAIFDAPLSDGSGNTLGNTLIDSASCTSEKVDDVAKELIQHFINKNKIIEAIVADTIAYNDVLKHSKMTTKKIENGKKQKIEEYSSEFWPFKVVQELNALDISYEKYFKSTYKVDNSKFDASFAALKEAKNQKKYAFINKTRSEIRAYMMV